MIIAKITDDIFNVFALNENQNLSVQGKKYLIDKIIKDVYDKGIKSGQNKAFKLCHRALSKLIDENNITH